MGGDSNMSIESGSRFYSIVGMKDEKGRVLTYIVYSHITHQIIKELNSLREAREYVRRMVIE